jgi:hypothetical protein
LDVVEAAFTPPFDKMTSTSYDFICAVAQNSKYPVMLGIIVDMFTQDCQKVVW